MLRLSSLVFMWDSHQWEWGSSLIILPACEIPFSATGLPRPALMLWYVPGFIVVCYMHD